MHDFVAKSFWNVKGIGFSYSNSTGRSGGLITLWKEEGLEVIMSFKGEGYIGVKVNKDNNFFYLVNVYSSCDIVKKRIMWSKLLSLKEDFNDGEWIIGGDFNAIKSREERKGRGVISNANEAIEFAEFIEKSLLVDVPCKGKKFSWYSGDGKSMSRLDRFLVAEKVLNNWGVIGQMVGERDISDHCPIWLEVDNNDWGPKPFKFNNEWFSHDSFYPFVENEWKSFKVEGRGDYILKQKLHLLKGRLKWWNKEVFGRIDLEIQEEVNDINRGDERLEVEGEDFNPDTLFERKEATSRFWMKLRIKENMLVQKANLKWLREGDSNSGYFHKVMKEKRRHNHLGPINTMDGRLDKVKDIKEYVAKHFSKKFEEEEGTSLLLEGINFDQICEEDKVWLERPFQEDEINDALKSCGGF
ncbi:uncharacterized protein LOC131642211 [Vicia villosa]|uniref:uncharacterized protein LOC131642211 n=1 Tax=Vicia villosa TaxID=3911 RepID=UPI00273B5585|nr:uncharacterized protein LOC131642211 [Vicia villosa]